MYFFQQFKLIIILFDLIILYKIKFKLLKINFIYKYLVCFMIYSK